MKKYSIANLAHEIRTLESIASILTEWSMNAPENHKTAEKSTEAFWRLYEAIANLRKIADVLDGYDTPEEITGAETAAIEL